MWRKIIFCYYLCCFFLEICFVSIYAVLPRNIFCRDLRAFVWRKIIEKLCLWRKKDEYEVWSYENTKNKRNYFYNLSVILKLRLNVTIILFFIWAMTMVNHWRCGAVFFLQVNLWKCYHRHHQHKQQASCNWFQAGAYQAWGSHRLWRPWCCTL